MYYKIDKSGTKFTSYSRISLPGMKKASLNNEAFFKNLNFKTLSPSSSDILDDDYR